MAESSIFWTTGGAGDGAAEYTQDQLSYWLKEFFCSDPNNEGVISHNGTTTALLVTGSTSPVAVAAGHALVNGFPYFNTTSVNLTVSSPASGTRFDRVVLRADYTARTVRLAVKPGDSGSYPALTQTPGSIWEISIAQIAITSAGAITLIDNRVFLHMNTRIKTAMIDDQAVTAAKIANGTITAAQIANLTITAAQIANATITGAKLVNGTIGSTQIGTGAVLEANLGTGAVSYTKLGGWMIDEGKVNVNIPYMKYRLGGHANWWNVGGTTQYNAGRWGFLMGATDVSISPGASSGSATVTLPAGYFVTGTQLHAFCGFTGAAMIGTLLVDGQANPSELFIYVVSKSGATFPAGQNATVKWMIAGPVNY